LHEENKNMKKILILAGLLAMISACGLQRPLPLTISLINPTGLPYEQQGGLKVTAQSMYNVRVDWDVTNTNAHGIKILIADGSDYDCDNPIATQVIYGILNSTSYNTDNSLYSSLGKIFESKLNLFTGGTYSVCLATIQYDRESSPSIPVFMELTQPQSSPMGFYYGVGNQE